jgi:hypothetical protein
MLTALAKGLVWYIYFPYVSVQIDFVAISVNGLLGYPR